MWIFLLLVAVPIIEIALFIEIGGALGLWPTLGIVVLTAFVGTVLLRSQGFAALSGLQNKIQTGEDPTGALAHGALILVAGVVLLTPGFFTDAVGLALLVPPVRAMVIRFLAKRITMVHLRSHGPGAPNGAQHGSPHGQPQRPQGGGETIDGTYEPIGDDAPKGPDDRR